MMGTGTMHSPGRDRVRRLAAVWRDVLVFGLIGGAAMGAAAGADDPRAKWSLAGVALVAMGYALWVGTVRYFQAIDEQERLAAYWSGMMGLYAYVFLFGAQNAVARFGLVVPGADRWTFWIVMAVTMATFLWKRYR